MIIRPDARTGVRALLVAALVAALAALGLALPATASAAVPSAAVPSAAVPSAAQSVARSAVPSAGVAAPVAPAAVPGEEESGLPVRALSSLPDEATDTYRLIRSGGPYPYSQDGTTFQNREGILPAKSSGYYEEYTVETPGSSTRGARRIVTGSGGEYYYTGDHYASFVVVDVSR
ncbi:ribonuclease domain-containing protein [Pseudonocardia spirodelae]|uniref:Ribonuclease domain-containing protein n=1 Tax=Pseudonocardia spirodelae TaxID=3133431 RepID=A0ABU8T5U3_9PSEU